MLTFLLFASAAFARADIAVLVSDRLVAYDAPVQRFREAVGRSVTVFEIDGDRDRADSIVKQLRADPPPLVFAVGAKAAYVAVNDLPDIPVVYAMVNDPSRYGISGTQVTGVSMEVPAEATLSQFQLFAPAVKKLGVMLSANNTASQVADALAAARRLGFETTVQRVTNARDVRAAWQRMAGSVDALWLLPDPVVMAPEAFRWLRNDTMRRRLPMLASTENLVRAGALLCVAPDRAVAGQQAAELARRILDSEELPGMIEPPPPGAMRVVLNRDTLDSIGLPVDELMLDFADEVVRESEGR
ncbi:MAG: ABC transporter substrate binding protein [Pseudomonadota bacterium]|nr:ABC transporter substrate binding protein [Pseudomonadota bacterium]